MHGTLGIVLLIAGLVIVLGLVGLAILLTVQKQHDPATAIFKVLGSAAIVVGVGFFIHHMEGELQDGFSFENFGVAVLMLVSIVVAGIVLSITWTPQLSDFIIRPLTSIFEGGNEPPEQKPLYSIAIAKRKRGKPREAIAEIRRQLEKFPHDFEGVMLLGQVQAEDLADLPGAEVTINRFCEWRDAPLKQVTAACMQVADWHLKLSGDAEAARAALRNIITRYPDTEAALLAEQRIAHLTEAETMILARRDNADVAMPEGVQNIGLLDSTEFLKPREIEPGRLAAAHVKHLETHPHDSEVREKLALIYAKDFKRLDLATMELEQLINEPNHRPKQTAHWLNMLADFQIELGADVATVRTTLEQITQRFPTLPVAELAQRRLARVGNEFKGLRQSSSVKMGDYEQNVGLKYGVPPRKQ
jgi:TolA-binding protein